MRDLSNLVKHEDIITSEHLTTLLAIVPKFSQKDWLENYETLTTYVVSTYKLAFCYHVFIFSVDIPEAEYSVMMLMICHSNIFTLHLNFI